jgi:phage gp36-like protein
MAYCTQADVQIAVGGERALIELTDQSESATVDVSIVADAIVEAEGYIDGYLHQRFATPLAIVAPEIKGMAKAWAARILRRNNYRGQPIADDQEAEKIDREWLTKVAEGKIQLSVSPTMAASDIVIDKAAPRDSTLDISRCKMKGFI